MARRSFDIQVIEAPVLEELLLGNNLQEGQIVNIYCNVRSGDLPIHFEWLKDGKRIPSSLKVSSNTSFTRITNNYNSPIRARVQF